MYSGRYLAEMESCLLNCLTATYVVLLAALSTSTSHVSTSSSSSWINSHKCTCAAHLYDIAETGSDDS